MGGKKRPPVSNAQKRELLSFFDNLPDGRSERNNFPNYTNQQYLAMLTLRTHFTPKQIEEMLNISVYKIHKMIKVAKIITRRLEIANAKATTLAEVNNELANNAVNDVAINAVNDAVNDATNKVIAMIDTTETTTKHRNEQDMVENYFGHVIQVDN